MARGQLITIEGIEGAGKTTAKEIILHCLHEHHLTVTMTREPGGTMIAEDIRQVLLSTQHQEKIHPKTELLLMFACRSQVIQEIITPALNRGEWVISDRYVDASYAYQGGGRNISQHDIATLDHMIVTKEQPGLTLLLDVPVKLGLVRAKNRNNAMDRIEQEKFDFFERVRTAYLQRADLYPERIKVIAADQPLVKVHQAITHHLEAFLQKTIGRRKS